MSALELRGKARLAALKGHKEGAGADKELAMDLKLKVVTDAGVLAYFCPTLKSLLFNPDTLQPRMPNLKPLKLNGSTRNMEMKIDTIDLPAVELKGFEIDALPGERVGLTFVAVAFPRATQMTQAWELLGNEVDIDIKPNGALLLGAESAAHATVADVVVKIDKIIKEKLGKADTPQTSAPRTDWPKPNAKGEYDEPGERLFYCDPVKNFGAWIRLLQIGPEAWVTAVSHALPGEEDYSEPLRGLVNPFKTRTVALLDSTRYLQEECQVWEKKNKRHADKAIVREIFDWATRLLIDHSSPTVTARPAKVSVKKPRAKRKD